MLAIAPGFAPLDNQWAVARGNPGTAVVALAAEEVHAVHGHRTLGHSLRVYMILSISQFNKGLMPKHTTWYMTFAWDKSNSLCKARRRGSVFLTEYPRAEGREVILWMREI